MELGNHSETFLFLRWTFDGLIRPICEGFHVVRRTPKDVSSFALSTGTKGTFSLMRSVGHLRDAAAKIRGAAVLAEHSRVMAVREIHEGDELVPAGSTGTIIHVIK